MSAWHIIVEPVEGNTTGVDEKNEGGMAVYLSNYGGAKQEFSRVGFARRHTRNPSVSFRRQLEDERDKARDAITVLNEQCQNGGVLV